MIRHLSDRLNYGLNEANFLVHLDPFASGHVTYSSCVTILSQIVTQPDSQSTLLLELKNN
jgi:hypothetical protein